MFHDWPAERGAFLARKSFESLPAGGRIVIHEVLYNRQKAGPFAAAAFSMIMLGWTNGGRQYSRQELAATLRQAGFRRIQIRPAFGYMSIVTGVKP